MSDCRDNPFQAPEFLDLPGRSRLTRLSLFSVVAIIISFYPLLPLYCTLKELAIGCPQGFKLEPSTELRLRILTFFEVFPSVFRVGMVCMLAYYIVLRYGSQRDLAWVRLSAVIPLSAIPLSFLLPFCIHKFPF